MRFFKRISNFLRSGLRPLQGLSWRRYRRRYAVPTVAPGVRSSLCKQADFLTERHRYWCERMRQPLRFHRKVWEFTYVAEALSARGMLAPGRRGLGFAVGTEPLPALFAAHGCEIVATDIHPEKGSAMGWENQAQLCHGVEDLNRLGICPPADFARLCRYQAVDMNAIPSDLRGFDFNWSSCSFEHLGGIEPGLAFLRNQLATLRPGGWAVHTTEYNLSSNDETLETPTCVIFRRRDIDRIVAELRSEGHEVAELDYSLGWLPFDYKVDFPPYSQDAHLRLRLAGFVCTSIGLIIRKKS